MKYWQRAGVHGALTAPAGGARHKPRKTGATFPEIRLRRPLQLQGSDAEHMLAPPTKSKPDGATHVLRTREGDAALFSTALTALGRSFKGRAVDAVQGSGERSLYPAHVFRVSLGAERLQHQQEG